MKVLRGRRKGLVLAVERATVSVNGSPVAVFEGRILAGGLEIVLLEGRLPADLGQGPAGPLVVADRPKAWRDTWPAQSVGYA